jgi:hypothetical protein
MDKMVDGVTMPMTAEEIAEFEATRSPVGTPIPETITDYQFFWEAAERGLITHADAEAAVAPGDIPSTMLALIEQLPEAERFGARIRVKGAVQYHRHDPLTETLGQLFGMDAAALDAFWTSAAAR